MRYYHPFPEAIPLSEAGCSRVTHPSATKNAKQAKHSPFDLHVLGVPPAFVLSQDQTLHRVVSPNWYLYQFWNLVHCESLAITVAFYSLVWLLKVQCRINCFIPNWPRVPVLFLPFLSRIVQFSRCSFCRLSEVFLFSALVRRLIYYTTLSEVCQAFFQTFFKVFLDFSLLKRFAFKPQLFVSRPAASLSFRLPLF